ncbi:MAG TPA: hypothetical protein VIT88_05200 [Pyrinomonadaceae bacterium]
MKTILLFPLAILMVVSLLAVWYSRRRGSPGLASDRESPISARFTIVNGSNTARSFLSNWQVTPQHDDRKPILVMQQQLSGFAPADRSTARRNQQRMYRQWSAERHD